MLLLGLEISYSAVNAARQGRDWWVASRRQRFSERDEQRHWPPTSPRSFKGGRRPLVMRTTIGSSLGLRSNEKSSPRDQALDVRALLMRQLRETDKWWWALSDSNL